MGLAVCLAREQHVLPLRRQPELLLVLVQLQELAWNSPARLLSAELVWRQLQRLELRALLQQVQVQGRRRGQQLAQERALALLPLKLAAQEWVWAPQGSPEL